MINYPLFGESIFYKSANSHTLISHRHQQHQEQAEEPFSPLPLPPKPRQLSRIYLSASHISGLSRHLCHYQQLMCVRARALAVPRGFNLASPEVQPSWRGKKGAEKREKCISLGPCDCEEQKKKNDSVFQGQT